MKKWKRRRRVMVCGGVYLLAALFMVFAGCADKLILFPRTEPMPSPGSQRRALPFQEGDLEVWVAPSKAGAPAEAFVLSFNGNADRAENAVIGEAHAWSGHPIAVWAVNYPGYGGSTGPAKLNRLAPAGLAAYDALRAEAGDRPIFVSGASLGTTVALHIAANRPVAGVILINPPPLRSLILGRFGWWNLWLIAGPIAAGVPSDLDSPANAGRAAVPGVFVLSERDEVVPIRYQRKVYDAYAGEKRAIFLAGGHNDPMTEADEQDLRTHLRWVWDAAMRKE